LVATVPLIAVLLVAMTGHRDRIDRRGLVGLLIGLVGVGVLLGLDVKGGDLGSVGEVGLVAVGYATGPLLAARYLGHLSSLALATVSLSLVAIGYAPVAVWQRPAHMPQGTVIAAVVVLGLVCTALAFVAFFELIKEIGSTRATVITYLNPAVAVVLGVALLGEQFKLGTALGFVLILAGSWLSTAPRGNMLRQAKYSASAIGDRLGEQG
jgi:drug/metabolite transporter (DMT)-like permease